MVDNVFVEGQFNIKRPPEKAAFLVEIAVYRYKMYQKAFGNAVFGVLVQGICRLETCFWPFGTVVIPLARSMPGDDGGTGRNGRQSTKNGDRRSGDHAIIFSEQSWQNSLGGA